MAAVRPVEIIEGCTLYRRIPTRTVAHCTVQLEHKPWWKAVIVNQQIGSEGSITGVRSMDYFNRETTIANNDG